MLAWVFFYRTKELEPKMRTKAFEQLFGKMQKSNYCRYQYQVKGKLPKKSYIRPVQATLIVRKRYVRIVSQLFDSYGIKYKVYEIMVDKSDFEEKIIL